MAAPVNIAAYKEIILVLGTAGVVVPVMSRLKISPVVGFLLAGIIMGPYGLSRLSGQFPLIEYVTISDSSEFPAFAELGILLLMFLIGIELSFNRLMTMRRLIFGFGGLQVLGSMAIIAFAAYYSGLSPQAAVLVGAAFSLSSTAIIIEELSLKKRLNSPVGRTAFAVLLKQDLAVIPFIILAGLMARQNTTSLADELWSALFSGVFAIVLLLFAGRYLFKPVLRVVVGTNSPDMFLAAVLSIVIGAGMTASYFGLSMALGGFAAGLLLAETEYRRMIESMIEPFKGILLGVFFYLGRVRNRPCCDLRKYRNFDLGVDPGHSVQDSRNCADRLSFRLLDGQGRRAGSASGTGRGICFRLAWRSSQQRLDRQRAHILADVMRGSGHGHFTGSGGFGRKNRICLQER